MEFTPQTAVDVMHRFGDFGDAVIRKIEIRPEDWSAQVELDAQDRTDDWAWCRVRFEFEGVKEWRFEQIRTDMVVIFEAKAAEADGLMFVGFDGAASSDPRPDDFRSTTAYIAARTVRWDVRPLG